MIAIGLFLLACVDKGASEMDTSEADTATGETTSNTEETGAVGTEDTEATDERLFYLADANVKFIGEAEEDYAGTSVSTAGDVNNDGFDDLFIGAYRNENGGVRTGTSYLIFGESDPATATGARELANADAELIGEEEDDYAGWSLSNAGDVNNDGYNDLIVGAFAEKSGGFDAGAAYLVLGGSDSASVTGELDLADADAKLIGEDEGDYAGYNVNTAEDVNDDGYDDLMVSAIQENIDGKGGTVYLVLGPVTGELDLSDANAKFIGENEGDDAGRTAGSAGDLDSDGYGDLFIGSYINENNGVNTGAAYLILGGTDSVIAAGPRELADADAKFIGEVEDDRAGYSVSGAGDVNNDGYDDLIIGAYYQDSGGSNSGAAYLVLGGSDSASVSGESGLADVDAKFIGENEDDSAGYSVSGAGDVNDDGFDDMIIGALGNSDGGYFAGAAYLVLGGAASASVTGEVDLVDADAKFIGEVTYDLAGWSVSGAGDVNNDGYDDLITGAYGNDSGGETAGAVYLILGGFF